MKTWCLLVAGSFALPLLVSAAAAEGPQPGQWKVTVKTESDGTPQPERINMRCLTPEQVKNIDKVFAPEQGATCQRLEYEWTGQKLAWRIKCTGAVTMDNSGSYVFDSPRHYTGTLTVRMVLPGRDLVSRTQIEGQHVGDCPPTAPAR